MARTPRSVRICPADPMPTNTEFVLSSHALRLFRRKTSDTSKAVRSCSALFVFVPLHTDLESPGNRQSLPTSSRTRGDEEADGHEKLVRKAQDE